VGRWGVAVRGGDCAGISPEAEGRAMQWSRGAGRRLMRDKSSVAANLLVMDGWIWYHFGVFQRWQFVLGRTESKVDYG